MSQTETNPLNEFFDGLEKTGLNYVQVVSILKEQATPDVLEKMSATDRLSFERSMADLTRETSKMQDILPLIEKAKREARNMHNNNL